MNSKAANMQLSKFCLAYPYNGHLSQNKLHLYSLFQHQQRWREWHNLAFVSLFFSLQIQRPELHVKAHLIPKVPLSESFIVPWWIKSGTILDPEDELTLPIEAVWLASTSTLSSPTLQICHSQDPGYNQEDPEKHKNRLSSIWWNIFTFYQSSISSFFDAKSVLFSVENG